jgi:enoyl-CoA hydratase/carnithine racemase
VTANELERQAFAGLFATEDAREGMQAFVAKRPASWKGA